MARPKLVRLNSEREKRQRWERERIKGQLVQFARDAASDIDGFAVVTFKHDPDGYMATETRYQVRDGRDLSTLPDLVKRRVASAIERNVAPRAGRPHDDDGAA